MNIFNIVTFAFNIVLVWLAGLLLPTSEKKGEMRFKVVDDKLEKEHLK